MSLGFSINPRLWFKTNHYKAKQDHAPGQLTKKDLATMVEQLVCIGELTHDQADDIYRQLSHYSELDLKKIIVRGMNNQSRKEEWDQLEPVDEDHDHEKDLTVAVNLFQDFMRGRIQ